MTVPFWRQWMRRAWFCGVVLFVVACGPGATPEEGSPAAVFDALEDRLLEAGTVQLEFHVTAEGIVEADLRGRLDTSSTGAIRLTGSGSFGGQAVDLLLQSDDHQMVFGDAANRPVAPRPTHLKEALLLGLTRMGILHNLARLASVAPPDHGDGGVRAWVTVGSFAADSAAVSFELTVAGEPSGSASLEIDSSGRPVVRRQTVQFSSGEMRVVERYSKCVIGP